MFFVLIIKVINDLVEPDLAGLAAFLERNFPLFARSSESYILYFSYSN